MGMTPIKLNENELLDGIPLEGAHYRCSQTSAARYWSTTSVWVINYIKLIKPSLATITIFKLFGLFLIIQ